MAFMAKTLVCLVVLLTFYGAASATELDFDPYAFFKLRAKSNGVFTPSVREELKSDLKSQAFSSITTATCHRFLLAEISDTVALRSPTQVTGINGNGTTVYFDPIEQNYFEQILPLVFYPRRFGSQAFGETKGLSPADQTSNARKRFVYETFRYVAACFAAGVDPDPAIAASSMGRKVLNMLWQRMNSPVPGIRETSSVDVGQDLRNAIEAWQQGALADSSFLNAVLGDPGFQWAFDLTSLLKFANAVEMAAVTNNTIRLHLLSEYAAAVINRSQNLQGLQTPGGVSLAHRRLFPSE